jgi:hypothetical protein
VQDGPRVSTHKGLDDWSHLHPLRNFKAEIAFLQENRSSPPRLPLHDHVVFGAEKVDSVGTNLWQSWHAIDLPFDPTPLGAQDLLDRR